MSHFFGVIWSYFTFFWDSLKWNIQWIQQLGGNQQYMGKSQLHGQDRSALAMVFVKPADNLCVVEFYLYHWTILFTTLSAMTPKKGLKII